MKNPSDPETIRFHELQVLRLLCQAPGDDFRHRARAALARYRFREPVFQLLFAILLELPAAGAGIIREQLAARMTNQGFPDFDLEALFEPHGLTAKEAESLLQNLAKAGGTPA